VKKRKKLQVNKHPYNPYIWLRYLIFFGCIIFILLILLITLYGAQIVNLINDSVQPIEGGTKYILGFIPIPLTIELLKKEHELFLIALKSILSLFDGVK